MDREEAWGIVCEFVLTESLRKHALAVESCMRIYARIYREDEDAWGVVGLLHDFDYEIHTTEADHPQAGGPILRARGVPEDVVASILSHGDHLQDAYPRRTVRDKSLAVVDQLSGLCTAVALVRPSKSIFDVDVAAVKKKWKDKAFARTVNRQEVERYINEFGLTREEHIERVLQALKENAELLGLAGNGRDE